MTEVHSDPVSSNPVSAANGARKARKARTIVRRYVATVNYGVTAAMAQSIVRMCPDNGPFSQSDYLRMVYHQYALANDPLYMKEAPSGRVQA
jgi:hypothetical protein